MLLSTHTSRNIVKIGPIDDVIGDYVIKNHELCWTVNIDCCIFGSKFKQSDPRMILHRT